MDRAIDNICFPNGCHCRNRPKRWTNPNKPADSARIMSTASGTHMERGDRLVYGRVRQNHERHADPAGPHVHLVRDKVDHQPTPASHCWLNPHTQKHASQLHHLRASWDLCPRKSLPSGVSYRTRCSCFIVPTSQISKSKGESCRGSFPKNLSWTRNHLAGKYTNSQPACEEGPIGIGYVLLQTAHTLVLLVMHSMNYAGAEKHQALKNANVMTKDADQKHQPHMP